MALHKGLGFKITRKNAKGTEFHATLEQLLTNPFIEKTCPGKLGQTSQVNR